MKTQFKSDEIAHVWANQSAAYGSSPGGVSFDGPVIKSYSTAMGRIVTHKGQTAFVLNRNSYSVTTSKHQGCIAYAIPHGSTVFYSKGEPPTGPDTGKRLFEYALEMAAFNQGKIARARNKGQYEAEVHTWLTRAQSINEFFGLRRKVDSEAISRLSAAKSREEARKVKEQAKRELADRQEQEAGYENWKDGLDSIWFNARLFPVAFRVESDELVSTMGARVPLQAARIALRFVLSKRQSGWHRNGETCEVGMYQLDAINERGIVAGCHRITWAEVERVQSLIS